MRHIIVPNESPSGVRERLVGATERPREKGSPATLEGRAKGLRRPHNPHTTVELFREGGAHEGRPGLCYEWRLDGEAKRMPIGQPPHESRTASDPDPMHKPFYRHRWPYVVLGAAMLIAVASGVVLGRVMRFDLPDVRALEDYNPPVMTSVLARDDSLVESFAEERRILIEYRDVPPAFLQALIATEDSNFYNHPGFDLKGIMGRE